MIAAVTVVLVTLVMWSAFSPRTLRTGRGVPTRADSRRPGLEPDPVGRLAQTGLDAAVLEAIQSQNALRFLGLEGGRA